MFVDDILIFCKANRDNIIVVEKCLGQYYRWTCQVLNVEKSCVFFSKNTERETKAMVKHILNMKELTKETRYLGNPLFLGANKL